MLGSEPTHGDILEKIGELKGQVATLIMLVGQKRDDMNAMSSRLSLIEKTAASHVDVENCHIRLNKTDIELAKWAGVCIALAFVMPVVMPQLQRALGVVPSPPIPHRGQP